MSLDKSRIPKRGISSRRFIPKKQRKTMTDTFVDRIKRARADKGETVSGRMVETRSQKTSEERKVMLEVEVNLQKLDCLKDLDLFETMCKILNVPMGVKRIWARKRLMPWFRADMTAWLYEYAKKHMSKHGRVYSGYQLDIGAGAFKRAFVTHRNAVTTAVKKSPGQVNVVEKKRRRC